MNRLGCLILLVIAAVVGGFFLIVKRGVLREAAPPSVATAPTAGAAPANLLIPVQGVRPAELVDSWGDARTGGGAHVHHALDILAPVGTPVLAVADGPILKIYESRLGGHTVYQRSADGEWTFYYAHLDGYAPGLAEGRVLKRGQPLGNVGATGDADPGAPHLHFEIHRMASGQGWWQGTEINPYPVLRGGA